MDKKRLMFSLVTLLAVATLLSFIDCKISSGAEKKPIKLGYVASRTGIFSFLGEDNAKTMIAYADWLNKKQGGIAGHPIELFVYDTQSDPVKGALAMRKVIELDKVHLVMGESATGVALGLAPVAAANKITYIANSGSEVFEKANKKAGPEQHRWCFRPVSCTDAEHITTLAWVVTDVLRAKKLAYLAPETGFGKAMLAAAKAILPRLGVELVVIETYPGDATTFGAQISKVKATPGVEVVTAYGAELASALCIAAFREAGYGGEGQIPLITWNTQAQPSMMALEKIKNAYEGLWTIDTTGPWDSMPEDHFNRPVLLRFAKFFKEVFGIRMSNAFEIFPLSTMVFIEDALNRLFKDQPNIMEKDLGTIRLAIRDYFEACGTLNNGMGVYSLSPDDHCGFHLGTQYNLCKFHNGIGIYHSRPPTAYFRNAAPKIADLGFNLGPKIGP